MLREQVVAAVVRPRPRPTPRRWPTSRPWPRRSATTCPRASRGPSAPASASSSACCARTPSRPPGCSPRTTPSGGARETDDLHVGRRLGPVVRAALPAHVDGDRRVSPGCPGSGTRAVRARRGYDIGPSCPARRPGPGDVRRTGSCGSGDRRSSASCAPTRRQDDPAAHRPGRHAPRPRRHRLRQPDLVKPRGPELRRLAWGGSQAASPQRTTRGCPAPGVGARARAGPRPAPRALGARRGPRPSPSSPRPSTRAGVALPPRHRRPPQQAPRARQQVTGLGPTPPAGRPHRVRRGPRGWPAEPAGHASPGHADPGPAVRTTNGSPTGARHRRPAATRASSAHRGRNAPAGSVPRRPAPAPQRLGQQEQAARAVSAASDTSTYGSGPRRSEGDAQDQLAAVRRQDGLVRHPGGERALPLPNVQAQGPAPAGDERDQHRPSSPAPARTPSTVPRRAARPSVPTRPPHLDDKIPRPSSSGGRPATVGGSISTGR